MSSRTRVEIGVKYTRTGSVSEQFNGTPHFLLPIGSKMAILDTARHRSTSETRNVATEPEVETGVEIALERKVFSDAIPAATPHFPLCPTQKWHCRYARHRRHRKPKCRHEPKVKPEVEITMNESSWRCDSNDLFHILDHVKLKCVTADTARDRRHPLLQNVDENRK